MPHEITNDEWERINEFANAWAYERDPEMLVPDKPDADED